VYRIARTTTRDLLRHSFCFPLLALVALVASLGAASANAAQDPYLNKRRQVLNDAGQRHLDLGLWCRDRGLVPQATAELLAAVEASERQHMGATTVASYMRNLDDGFWKKRRKSPSASIITAYEKRAAKVRTADQKDRLKLAKLAWKRKMKREAEAEYEAILRAINAPLKFDNMGNLILEGAKVPPELSKAFRTRSVQINGQLYLRDALLDLVPDITAVHEVESTELRVRGNLPAVQLRELHAIAVALFPHLETALHAKPGRKLHLFIFPDRKSYDAYLDGISQAAYKNASGMAQRQGLLAVICAEGFDAQSLQALALHELTHLYTYATSRAVMPSWYSEGFAEIYGGQGTFTWDGSTLTPGGRLAEFRLAPLRDPATRYTIQQILDADALNLFATDKQRALNFYVQSWALVKFLRQQAEPELRRRFTEWEEISNGAALGAQFNNYWSRNVKPANELFLEMFAKDLDQLEIAYQSWLSNQASPSE
jgi:hypothetical protein